MSNEPNPSRRAESPAPGRSRKHLSWLASRLLPVAFVVAAGVLLIFLVGIAQRIGWLVAPGSGTGVTAEATDAIYTCPMHPQIRQPGDRALSDLRDGTRAGRQYDRRRSGRAVGAD